MSLLGRPLGVRPGHREKDVPLPAVPSEGRTVSWRWWLFPHAFIALSGFLKIMISEM